MNVANKPKISIIIPIYNVEEYLKNCLDSIVNQTLKNIEIICVNDGSTDDSQNILLEYANKDSRIIVINQENQGVSAARNIGLKNASGEYTQFIDADDWIDNNCCKTIYEYAHAKNADLLMFGGLDYFSDNNIKDYWANLILKKNVIDISECNEYDFDMLSSVVWNKLYKTKKIKKIIFIESLKTNEDGIFNEQYLLTLQQVHLLNKNFYFYRKNRYNSAMHDVQRCLIYDFDAIQYITNSDFYSKLTEKYKMFILHKHLCGIHFHLNRNQEKVSIKQFLIVYKVKKYFHKNLEKNIYKNIKAYTKLKSYSLFKYIIENIFSVKNKSLYKVCTLLGFKIKFQRFIFKRFLLSAIENIQKKYQKLDDLPFDIDIVYTWIDGMNEENIKLRETWQKKLGIYDYRTNKCRFVDNNELKYSLGLLEKNAPWIRNIYIVTDGTSPSWLNINHPKIKIINQYDILPIKSYPCFSSDAIETCIVNIPNLSEHFLYANDDMFIMKPVKKSFFFTKDGKAIVSFNNTKHWADNHKTYTSYVLNILNTQKLFFNKFHVSYQYETTHNIDAYIKSAFYKTNEIFNDVIRKCQNYPFRISDNWQRIGYSYYLLLTGLGELKIRKFLLSHLNKDDIWIEHMNIPCSAVAKLPKLLKRYNPTLLCVNDNESTTDEDRKKFKMIFSKIINGHSSFELF